MAAQPDEENEEFDEENDGRDDQMGEDSDEDLSKKDRVAMLRDHPVLAARLFEIRSRLMLEEVFTGADKPFGKVTDFWGRVEFQGDRV